MKIFFIIYMVVISCIIPGTILAEEPATQPAELPVVKTYGDLLKQEPITLGCGVKVRLGIQSNKPVAGDGVLVYCLTDDSAMKHRPKDVGIDDTIGPLAVRVEREGTKTLLDKEKVDYQIDNVTGTILFANAVNFPEAGRYRVIVEDVNDKTTTVVESIGMTVDKPQVKPAQPPWIMFQHEKKLHKLKIGESETVLIAEGHIGLPKWNGIFPRVFQGKSDGVVVAHKPEELLPRCVPANADAGMKLTVQGDLFTIDWNEEMVELPVTQNWLACWWVNGKPVTASKPVDDLIPELNDAGRRIVESKRFQFHVKISPQQLGAKKSDTVAVQLLYCDGGVEEIRVGGLLMRLHHEICWKSGCDYPSVRMSNRAEFVLPQ